METLEFGSDDHRGHGRGDRKRKVILAVAASDAHVVANVLIAVGLRRRNFDVVNLGVCTLVSEICEANERHPDAEAVLLGSLNGHAYEDLRDLPKARSRWGLHLPLILGGNLSVGSRKDPDHLKRLYDRGVSTILSDVGQLVPTLDGLRLREAVAA